MKIRIKGNAESWISLNVVSDAFATSLFTAGIGYYTAEVSLISASYSMRAVGIGVLLGTFSSLAIARMADLFGTVRLLAGVQFLQIACYIYLGFGPRNPASIFTSILLIFFLGRLVSPLRGTLPPLYLKREQLLEFKTKLRTITLTVVFLASITVSLVAALHLRMEMLIVLVGIASYGSCVVSTLQLSYMPNRGANVTNPSPTLKALSLSEWRIWFALFVIFSIISVSASITPYAISSWGSKTSWLITFSSVVGIIINIAIHRIISTKERSFNRYTNHVQLAAAGGMGLAALSILSAAIWFSAGLIPFSLAMVVVIVTFHTGQTIATVVAWDIQYNAGSDHNRALIVAIYSLSASLGTALAQLLGANIYNLINR